MRIGLTFDLDIRTTDMSIITDHLLINYYVYMLYVPTSTYQVWSFWHKAFLSSTMCFGRPTYRRTKMCKAISPLSFFEEDGKKLWKLKYKSPIPSVRFKSYYPWYVKLKITSRDHNYGTVWSLFNLIQRLRTDPTHSVFVYNSLKV